MKKAMVIEKLLEGEAMSDRTHLYGYLLFLRIGYILTTRSEYLSSGVIAPSTVTVDITITTRVGRGGVLRIEEARYAQGACYALGFIGLCKIARALRICCAQRTG